jgi:hypothetical protein
VAIEACSRRVDQLRDLKSYHKSEWETARYHEELLADETRCQLVKALRSAMDATDEGYAHDEAKLPGWLARRPQDKDSHEG